MTASPGKMTDDIDNRPDLNTGTKWSEIDLLEPRQLHQAE